MLLASLIVLTSTPYSEVLCNIPLHTLSRPCSPRPFPPSSSLHLAAALMESQSLEQLGGTGVGKSRLLGQVANGKEKRGEEVGEVGIPCAIF